MEYASVFLILGLVTYCLHSSLLVFADGDKNFQVKLWSYEHLQKFMLVLTIYRRHDYYLLLWECSRPRRIWTMLREEVCSLMDLEGLLPWGNPLSKTFFKYFHLLWTKLYVYMVISWNSWNHFNCKIDEKSIRETGKS